MSEKCFRRLGTIHSDNSPTIQQSGQSSTVPIGWPFGRWSQQRGSSRPGEVQKRGRLLGEAVLCWIITGAVILNAQAQVCGIPALVLRRLLRRTMHDFWTRKVLARELKISPERASRLISALRDHAYVEPVPNEPRGTWRNTTLGNAFANATAARPVKRRVAERRLSEFLNRVRHVNAKPAFLCRVTEVVVFGSYLSSKSKMGDVDLAIHVEPKPEYRDGWAERVLAHAAEAEARGRRFSRFADRLGWAEQETRMFLKAGSRSLSLHDLDNERPLFSETPHQIVFRLGRN